MVLEADCRRAEMWVKCGFFSFQECATLETTQREFWEIYFLGSLFLSRNLRLYKRFLKIERSVSLVVRYFEFTTLIARNMIVVLREYIRNL